MEGVALVGSREWSRYPVLSSTMLWIRSRSTDLGGAVAFALCALSCRQQNRSSECLMIEREGSETRRRR